MPIRVNVAEVWLSQYLPLEDIVANYPPLANAPQLIVIMQLTKLFFQPPRILF